MKRRILILCFAQILLLGGFSQETLLPDSLIFTFTVKPTSDNVSCLPNYKYKKFVVLESNHKKVVSSIYISNSDIKIDIDDSKTYIIEGKITYENKLQYECFSFFKEKRLVFIKPVAPKILIRKKLF